MITRKRLRSRARVAASGVSLDDADWDDLCDDAIAALWQTIVKKNVDFRVKPVDFSLTSTAVNSVDLAAIAPDFNILRSLCRDFGMSSEQYLNKVGPRTGSLGGERGYRLENTLLVIEPFELAVGNYRLKYTPQPPLLTSDSGATGTLDLELVQFVEFIVRHMAVAALVSEESPIGEQKDLFDAAQADVVTWASGQRSADPDTVEDVRGRRWGLVRP